MPRSRVLRALPVLLVVMAFTASSSWAAPHRASGDAQPNDVLAPLWAAFSAVWADLGCLIDPNGVLAGTDLGCKIDPSGEPAESDLGCDIDPHGACRPHS